IVETGTPTVVFLVNGRPLSINYEKEHVPAIVEGWYLGEQGGTAAANVLFGDVNPGGKLPISFPKSVGQLPDYYDHKPSRDRSYLFDGREPIFPFGFGLSYTQFQFDNVRVEPTTIKTGGEAKVSVDITNTGSRAGDEVAQLYVHQRVASRTRPVKQLRGFKRVSLQPGQKTTVEFTVKPEDLSLIDFNMNQIVEPGTFDLMVGPSSVETTSVPLQVTN
ncbi:MAG TPA: glycoside hydrolase family 3 C-terminal domain-containing protein, partial [Nitrospira sp.]|nr:glycoside hydrolase family 3 C-terminal domain-containing protein [Nitrospira sp.]